KRLFLALYERNGTPRRFIAFTDPEVLVYMRALANRGNDIAVAGTFNDRLSFSDDPANPLKSRGSADIFVSLFHEDGSLIWVEQAGGEEPDYVTSLAGMPGGSLLVGGEFRDHGGGTDSPRGATFGRGPSIGLRPWGPSGAFVAAIGAEGRFEWVKRFGGEEPDDFFSHETVAEMFATGDGGSLVLASTALPATFGTSEQTLET